jgi:hypothetical protein
VPSVSTPLTEGLIDGLSLNEQDLITSTLNLSASSITPSVDDVIHILDAKDKADAAGYGSAKTGINYKSITDLGKWARYALAAQAIGHNRLLGMMRSYTKPWSDGSDSEKYVWVKYYGPFSSEAFDVTLVKKIYDNNKTFFDDLVTKAKAERDKKQQKRTARAATKAASAPAAAPAAPVQKGKISGQNGLPYDVATRVFTPIIEAGIDISFDESANREVTPGGGVKRTLKATFNKGKPGEFSTPIIVRDQSFGIKGTSYNFGSTDAPKFFSGDGFKNLPEKQFVNWIKRKVSQLAAEQSSSSEDETETESLKESLEKKPVSNKVNIRESLNKIDLRTDNKYDLRNLYDSCIMNNSEKRTLAEMIDKGVKADFLHESLMDKLEGKTLTEGRQPKAWNSMFAVKVLNDYDSGKLTDNNIDEWETEYNGGIKPYPPFSTRDILRYYKQGHDIRKSASESLEESGYTDYSETGNPSWHDDYDYDEDSGYSPDLPEKYTLVGVDGNAYAIMGYTANALKREGLRNLVDQMYKEATSGDYDNLIRVCYDYVEKANIAAYNKDESLTEARMDRQKLADLPVYVIAQFYNAAVKRDQNPASYIVSKNGDDYQLRYSSGDSNLLADENMTLSSDELEELVRSTDEVKTQFLFADHTNKYNLGLICTYRDFDLSKLDKALETTKKNRSAQTKSNFKRWY